MSGTPKNGDGINSSVCRPDQPETQELSYRQTALNLCVLTGNPEIAGEIQILKQVFQTEMQIFLNHNF